MRFKLMPLFFFIFLFFVLGTVLGGCSKRENTAAPASVSDIGATGVLPLQDGPFSTLAYDSDYGLVAITRSGVLQRYADGAWQVLAEGVLPQSRIGTGRGRLSVVSKEHTLIVVQGGQTLRSTFTISPWGGFVHLGLAAIVIAEEEGKYYLARVAFAGLRRSAICKTREVLPDAVPLQIDLDGGADADGHIAVLYQPTEAYPHGVLGDRIEAKGIMYVERHSLKDIKQPCLLPGTYVFEDNELRAYKHQIVSVISGGGSGAALALIGAKGDKMTLRKGTPLPTNRWLSPFVYHGKLYAIHTPHIGGLWYQYDDQLRATFIERGFSNHKIGDRILNISAATKDKVVLLRSGFKRIFLYDKAARKVGEAEVPEGAAAIASDGKDQIYVLDNKGIIHFFRW